MFPFLIEILSLAAETPTKKVVWFLLLLCSHWNLKEELKEVKGQKQYQEEDYAQVWAPCQEEALIAILLFAISRIRWKLQGKTFPQSSPAKKKIIEFLMVALYMVIPVTLLLCLATDTVQSDNTWLDLVAHFYVSATSINKTVVNHIVTTAAASIDLQVQIWREIYSNWS